VSELSPKITELGATNVQDSGVFSLASQVEISQITLLLVSNQILMQFHAAVIITFFSAECIVLNGQIVRLNLNGMAKGMLSAAVWC
jgi:hypothetical protein